MLNKHLGNPSQILAECQAKIHDIDRKLCQIKSRFKPGRKKQKYNLCSNEDFIVLRKETESLESDLQFVKSLLDDSKELDSSFPIRIMKKVFPSKVLYNKKTESNEIKAKIIAHSTALLEEKVNTIQTIAKRKRRKPKLESRDSMITETSNSVKPCKWIYKAGASSDSEIIMNTEKINSMKILSTLQKNSDTHVLNKDGIKKSGELQYWKPKSNSYFIPMTNCQSNNLKKKSEFTVLNYAEEPRQRVEVHFPKNKVMTQKYAQTDFPMVTWTSTNCDQDQITKKVDKGINTDILQKDEYQFLELNPNLKLIQDSNQEIISNSILNINEIEKVINSLLCSPLEMLQNNHNYKTAKGCFGPSGYLNLIIRQSDFMPLLVSGIEERKKNVCKEFAPAINMNFAYIYCLKQTSSTINLRCNERQGELFTGDHNNIHLALDYNSSANENKKKERTEYVVQYENTNIKNKPMASNTFQIDYKNPQTSGRIVMTEFGSNQSTQSEMISRILTHLIDLSNIKEKN